jgi:hypothetical protein
MRVITISMVGLGVLVLAACPADRQAAEPVDMSPDPRIEQAPAYPTPPGEVPMGVQPDTPGMGADTLGATQPLPPADQPGDPARPGALPANRP